MIGIHQARPPYIEFYVDAVLDQAASDAAGRRVTKDVNMVRIIPPGGQLIVEKKPEEWIAQLKRKAIERTHDAFPQEWIDNIQKSYDSWKAGLEPPLNGTSVKEWALLSPAQAQNFINMRILTIEDVAAMTEEAMARVGMGSRNLRDKAREWLQAKEIASNAVAENAELKAKLATLEARLAELESTESEKPKRGRPKLLAA